MKQFDLYSGEKYPLKKNYMNCYVAKAANESKDVHLALRPSYYHLAHFILIGCN